MVQIDRRVYDAAIGDIIESSYEHKRDQIKTTKFDLLSGCLYKLIDFRLL